MRQFRDASRACASLQYCPPRNAHGMELREVLLVAANLMAPGVAVTHPTQWPRLGEPVRAVSARTWCVGTDLHALTT